MITAHELQRIAASGWRAEIEEERDGWLLRANSGFTKRANSALPLTDDVERLVDSLPLVEDFYLRLGAPTIIQLPADEHRELDDELSRRGFEPHSRTCVLTAAIPDVLAEVGPDETRVELSTECSDEWLDACERLARPLGVAGRQLMARHPGAVFAAVRNERGRIVGVARAATDSVWVGLSTSAVEPAYRQRGLGSAMIRARLSHAVEAHGARHAYVQVEEENAFSLAMCAKAGFTHHHTYHYRIPPRNDARRA